MTKANVVGTISPLEIILKRRGRPIRQKGGPQGSEKGGKGYDRSRAKRGAEKDWR